MKTIETINTLCQKDTSLYRAHRDELLNNIKTLDECVGDAVSNGGKVRDAVKLFVSKVGEYAANVTVASLINRSAWDGRISTANANWAKSVKDAWDEESMARMYAYTKMHMAHLDQTADYVRRNLGEIAAEIEAEQEAKAEAGQDEISKQDTLVARANGLIDTLLEQATADKDDGRYDYLNAVKLDVAQYIHDNVTLSDYDDLDDLREELNDDLWVVDSVTGNGSGSYTFSRCTAKEYVVESGLDYLVEAMTEFGQLEEIGPKMADGDWEFLDVTIRCYLLGQAIDTVLDDLGADNLLSAA